MSMVNYLVDVYHVFDSGGTLHRKGCNEAWINWHLIQVKKCDPCPYCKYIITESYVYFIDIVCGVVIA